MQPITETSKVAALLPMLMAKPSWGLDYETTGLDANKDKVILAQIGRPEEQFLIDARKASLEPLKPFLQSEQVIKVAHHAKFEYKMTRGTADIRMENLRCTMIGDQVLNAGRKKAGFSLEDVAFTRLGISFDKTLQKSFIGHTGDFSREQLEYASRDVEHLIPLMQHEVAEMRTTGLLPTFKLECDAIPAFGDMEFDGCLLDVEGWQKLIAKNEQLTEEAKKVLDRYAEPFVGTTLFGDVDINYGSPSQLVRLLNLMQLKIKVRDQRSGEETLLPIKNTSKDTLKQLREVPFIQQLQKFRGYRIRINTFGDTYIKAVHPLTGRLHQGTNQCGTDTGRPSNSGNVSLLNIPRENEYRHCFICYLHEIVESDDYSGCESRILAEISQDPKLIDIFRRGADIHCETATGLYGVTVTKDNEHKRLRQPAKNLGFGLSYGMGPGKLYTDLNNEGFKITYEDAKGLYYKYCELYATAVAYLRESGRTAVKQGYLSNLNGRRRYWRLPDPDEYEGGTYNSDYAGRVATIERQGGNFMIQSVNADITKKAMADIRRYAIKNNIRTSFMNAVYDEIVTRTHKEDSVTFHAKKLQIMEAAGATWIKSVPMIVDGHTDPFWTK